MVDGRTPVEEEARNLEVGEVHSLEAGIVAVAGSYAAAPGRGRTTWWCGTGKCNGLTQTYKAEIRSLTLSAWNKGVGTWKETKREGEGKGFGG